MKRLFLQAVKNQKANNSSFLFFSLMVIAFLLSPCFIYSQNYNTTFNPTQLTAFIWTRSYEVTDMKFTPRSSTNSPLERITNQAILYLPLMIYGAEFTFEPNSNLHRVEQQFDYQPSGRIPSEKVFYELLTKDKERVEYLIRYRTLPTERSRREFWSHSRFISSGGRGEASLFEGFKAREKAVNAALKNAVINHFQVKLANKPRKIKGRFLLVEAPRVFLNKGHLFAEVQILIEESSVIDFHY